MIENAENEDFHRILRKSVKYILVHKSREMQTLIVV